MLKRVLFLCGLLFQLAIAQTTVTTPAQDSSLNNLLLPEGVATALPGTPGNVTISGTGIRPVILIAGLGFGKTALKKLVSHFNKHYKVYTVTPAGFEGTAPPPMPDNIANGIDLSWTNGLLQGILMLIKTYKLEKPDVIAHFVTSTQVALNLALQYPDKIGKVVIIGGAPYRYYAGQKNGQWNDWENEMRLTRLQREQLVEKYWAPKWFKTVTKVTWDANMWAPEDYCINSKQGKKLFKKSAAVALPVMVRYLLEWMVYDINDSYSKIVNPTLVLTPDFDGLIQFAESEERKANDVSVKKYLRYFHLEAWRPAILACNNQLKFQMISHSRLFTWIDNPGMTFKCIDEFLGN